MIIPELPNHSRVLIFGSNRLLESHEKEALGQLMDEFVSDWKAHGASITASYTLIHDSILIVAVDESVTPPSGCSIDKVFKLLTAFQVDFLQRMLIWQPFCNTSKIVTLVEAKEALEAKIIDLETMVINSLVSSLGEARERLYIPLKESWAWGKIQK